MSLKKVLTLGLAGAMSMMMLASCGGGNDTTTTTTAADAETTTTAAAETTTAAASKLEGKLVASGSTSVQPLMEVLAEDFMAKNPGVTVEVQAGGSTAGFENVSNGTTELGNLSRELKDSEKGADINEHVLAIDGIGVIVHPNNTVEDLTKEQIVDIFTGKVKNWSEVGGADAEIVVIQREGGSGTRDAFEELLDIEDQVVATQDANETGIVKNTVAGNENAIGYISLGSADDTIKLLSVGGVAPEVKTVTDGSYIITRPFLTITKGTESDLAKAWFEYTLSPDAVAIINDEGFFDPNA